MQTRRLFLTLALSLFFASTHASEPEIADSMRDSEGEVIASFLNSLIAKHPTDKLQVIEDATVSDDMMLHEEKDRSRDIKQRLPTASRAVIADFLRVNSDRARLRLPQQMVSQKLDYVIAHKEHIIDIFDAPGRNGWKAFHEEYPNSSGIWRFSRVGFDPGNKKALIYVSHSCGMLCGFGTLILLRHDSGKWRIAKMKQLWIS